jgi:hypothetical protein
MSLMEPLMKRTALYSILALLLTACSGDATTEPGGDATDEGNSCSVEAACSEDEVCVDGACQTIVCESAEDCPGGYDCIMPEDEANFCQPSGMPSDDENTVIPVNDASAPAEDVSPGEEDTAGPEGDGATSEEDTAAPENDVTPPEEDVTTPEEDVATPEEDVTTPEEDVATPEEDTSTSDFVGSTPSECGAPGQGLVPIDCTAYGDADATCVFSNHCMCSEGFACEANYPGTSGPECAAGSTCYTAGTMPTSCGSPGQGVETVDCTAAGDMNATCVFGNHCMCGEGYVCEELYSPDMTVEECAAGSECLPASDI